MFSSLQVLVIISSLFHTTLAATSSSPIVAQYWPAYSTSLQSPQQVPWSTADIMLYFVTVTTADGFRIADGQSEDDIKSFVTLARQNNVRPVFTVGGWTGSVHFSRLAAKASSRKSFATQVQTFLKKWNFDGVDLDWEYPGETGIGNNSSDAANDSNNFLLLLEEIRSAIGPNALITGAVSMKGFSANGQVLSDLSPFAKWFDYIMIMAYDVSGGWSKDTGPLAPLHACSSGVGVDTSIEAWTTRDFPAHKILLGLPGYGISFQTKSSQLTNSTTIVGGYPTQLYNAKTDCTPRGDSSDVGNGAATADSTDVCNGGQSSGYSGQWKMKKMIEQGILSKNEKRGLQGYKRYWDECTQTPFLFNVKRKNLISYEDSESIKIKAAFAMKAGLAGVMIFDTLGFSDNVYEALSSGLSVSGKAWSAPMMQASSGASLQGQAADLGDLGATSSSLRSTGNPSTMTVTKPTATALATAPSSLAHIGPSSSAPIAPDQNGLANFIRCDSLTTWSLCTSESCTSMGNVAPGTRCKDGEIVCASSHVHSKRRAPPMLMRGNFEGSARLAAGHTWRRYQRL